MIDDQALLKEMKNCIGNKEPIQFFIKLTEVIESLFEKITLLRSEVKSLKRQTALAIQWDSGMALDLIAEQIKLLKKDPQTYVTEIDLLQQAYLANTVTQNYNDFCIFWKDTLGWHPFIDYEA